MFPRRSDVTKSPGNHHARQAASAQPKLRAGVGLSFNPAMEVPVNQQNQSPNQKPGQQQQGGGQKPGQQQQDPGQKPGQQQPQR